MAVFPTVLSLRGRCWLLLVCPFFSFLPLDFFLLSSRPTKKSYERKRGQRLLFAGMLLGEQTYRRTEERRKKQQMHQVFKRKERKESDSRPHTEQCCLS
jgi:hypothetical protein